MGLVVVGALVTVVTTRAVLAHLRVYRPYRDFLRPPGVWERGRERNRGPGR